VALTKAFLVGVAGALLGCVLWILATVLVPALLPVVIQQLSDNGGGGASAAGVYFSTGPLLIVAVIGFAAGFAWQLRRSRTPR
jgi:hypothetical protein